jgi:hypothetical protein
MSDSSLFSSKLRVFEKSLSRAYAAKVEALGAELLEKVKEKTPVDTGAAKEAWELKLEGDGFDRKAIISNGLPYVAELEYGSSSQAPLGMLALSIEEMKP